MTDGSRAGHGPERCPGREAATKLPSVTRPWRHGPRDRPDRPDREPRGANRVLRGVTRRDLAGNGPGRAGTDSGRRIRGLLRHDRAGTGPDRLREAHSWPPAPHPGRRPARRRLVAVTAEWGEEEEQPGKAARDATPNQSRRPRPPGAVLPARTGSFRRGVQAALGQAGLGQARRATGAIDPFVSATRSPGASSISSPRRPADTWIVGNSPAETSRTVGSGRRVPSGLIPPST